MPEFEMWLPVKPVPKARPRVGRWGVYTPKRTVDAEMELVWCVKQKWPKIPPISGAVELEVIFFTKRPQTGQNKAQDNNTKRPDLDNLIKLVCDALNGLVWIDDSQIWRCVSEKKYGDINQIYLKIIWEKQAEFQT